MKVAVSIPDPVFNRADALAKRMKVSRSQVFARALDEYVDRHGDEDLTEAINRALDAIGDEGPDLFLREANRRSFSRLDG
jgi:metal-responsive CopG/Arc/MetJ family transcriptional regulator